MQQPQTDSPSHARVWQPAPPPLRVLIAGGWLSEADAASPLTRQEDYSRSHSVVRVTAPDGRSAAVKHVPRNAWEAGRSLLRELYVYRLAAWVPGVAAVVAPPILIDERRQLLAVEWIEQAAPLPEALPELLGRAMAGWHAATMGLPMLPSLSIGVLALPEGVEVACEGRSAASQRLMRGITAESVFGRLFAGCRAHYRQDCLIHGDVRMDNLRLYDSPARGSGIRVIDWEMSGAGDDAWDFASACAEFMLSELRAGREMRLDASSGWPAWVESQCSRFTAAYSAGRPVGDEFFERAVSYVPARLVHVALECTELAADLNDPHVRSILTLAEALIAKRAMAGDSLRRWAA